MDRTRDPLALDNERPEALDWSLLATRRLYTGLRGLVRGCTAAGMGNGGSYQLCTLSPSPTPRATALEALKNPSGATIFQ